VSVITRAVDILRYEGVRSTLWRGAKWVTSRSNPFGEKPLSSVFKQDVLAVDWTVTRDYRAEPLVSATGRPQVAWVISPPSRSSGGHQNAYQFMKYLEDAGYDITIFLYSTGKYPRVSFAGIQSMLAGNGGYAQLKASYEMYDPQTGIRGEYDIVVATDWATAYAAARYEKNVPRAYWVQDFEPFFFPAGPDFVVAENSYRLGLHGIAIGPWLAQKLTREYGMPCDFYEYAVNSARYQRTNDAPRNEILFYARPTTARRGTEFGLLVLDEVHRRRPEIVINIAGWDMSKAGLEFPFVNHGTLDVSELPALYNKCAAALVLSLTCMSLLPLEVMACGVVPVVNDGENTRVTLRDDPRIEFVPMSPALMADRIIAAVDRPDAIEHSRFLASSSEGGSWAAAGEHVVGVFDRLVERTH
jgi:glycosyltransferase involved in cell wall biosynthesis